MAIGRTNTGGGGGGLNFNIVGSTTAPSSPKENMIWVNTEIPITSWSFSATEPSSPSEGMVWFHLALSSPVAFNASKKNTVMLYPVSASIYVAGSWVSKNVKSYQGDAWVDWWVPGTLFADGQSDDVLTGGWASFAYSAGSGYTTKTVGVNVSAEGISAELAGTGYHSTFIGTNKKIDVSGYSTLRFEFSKATATSGSGSVAVRLYSDAGYTTAVSGAVIDTSGNINKTVEIDVSGLSGEYYIGWFLWTWGNCTLSTTMTLARLE